MTLSWRSIFLDPDMAVGLHWRAVGLLCQNMRGVVPGINLVELASLPAAANVLNQEETLQTTPVARGRS